MNTSSVAVFGGTGFLGRHVVTALRDAGRPVRIAVRRPGRVQAGEDKDIEAVRADVRDAASVAKALEGCVGAVNCVSLYAERGGATFEAVHVEGAENVARQAAGAGLETLVLVSGIGADTGSPSAYVRARAHGERAVRTAFPDAVVLRPSVLFGPGDSFFTTFAAIARLSPVLPLFGRGRTRLQPVFAGDVARAVAAVIAEPAARGRTYELGGPRVYTHAEILRLVLRRTGRRRALLPVPFAVWEGLAMLMRVLPAPPLTRDMIALMRKDNVVDGEAPGFADLGIAPRAAEDILPDYIAAPAGR